MTLTGYYRDHARQLLEACRWWRYWLHRRPILVGSLTVIALSWLLILCSTAPAFAADAAASAALVDSSGIPIEAYAELPVDSGGLLSPGGQANHWVLSSIWSAAHQNAIGLLGAFSFVFSFEWLLWLATPFEVLSFVIRELFGHGAGVVALLTLTALIAGVVALTGRVAAGFTEILLAVIASALLAGVLQNPTTWLIGEHGALSTAAEWARELAAVTATGERGTDTDLSTAVTMPLVDIAVRMPFHHTAFGEELTGECARILDRALLAGDDGQAIRDQISGCNPAAADRAAEATPPMVTGLLLTVAGRTGALLPIAIGLLTVMVTVVLVLFDSVKMLLGLYIALLPFNKQMAWRAGLGMVMGLLAMLIEVVLIVGWAKAVVELIRLGTDHLGYEAMQYTLGSAFLALALLLVTVAWQMRQRSKALADRASQLGASMQPVKPLPVAAAAGVAWKAADAAMRLAMHKRLGELGKNTHTDVKPSEKAVRPKADVLPNAQRQLTPGPRPAPPNPSAGSPSPSPSPSSPSPAAPAAPIDTGVQEGRFERVDPRPRRSRVARAGAVAAGTARVAIAGAVSGGTAAVAAGARELGGAALAAGRRAPRRVVADPKTGVATITSLPRPATPLPPAPPRRAIASTPAQRELAARLREARA